VAYLTLTVHTPSEMRCFVGVIRVAECREAIEVQTRLQSVVLEPSPKLASGFSNADFTILILFVSSFSFTVI